MTAWFDEVAEFPSDFTDRDLGADFSERYRAGGWRRGLEPTRFFNSTWYALEHNDWTQFRSPFDHFIHRGLDLGLSPSPFVDVTQLARSWPDLEPSARFQRLVSEGAAADCGVLASPYELGELQRTFLDKVEPVLLRNSVQTQRNNLVFVQNHESPQLSSWMTDHNRTFDIWVNHYAGVTHASGDGDIETAQIGTKFSGIYLSALNWPELLVGYERILLIDDDVVVAGDTLQALFACAVDQEAVLAQATLDPASHTSWPDLKRKANDTRDAVQLNTVEIMMPIMHSDFFWRAIRYMPKSISGYGLDAVWADMLADSGDIAWRLPPIAQHHGQVDQGDGLYYDFLRQHHLNPHAERWVLEAALGLTRGIARCRPTKQESHALQRDRSRS